MKIKTSLVKEKRKMVCVSRKFIIHIYTNYLMQQKAKGIQRANSTSIRKVLKVSVSLSTPSPYYCLPLVALCLCVFPGGSVEKNLPAKQETPLGLWVWKIPWRREWQHTPVFLPGKSHRRRSLSDYSP